MSDQALAKALELAPIIERVHGEHHPELTRVRELTEQVAAAGPEGDVKGLFAELRTVYDGPVVQTQDLTVINITRQAVISRQAKVFDQLPPIPGEQRVQFTPTQVPPPTDKPPTKRPSKSKSKAK